MDETVKEQQQQQQHQQQQQQEQQTAVVSGKSKLRYPLRSASKSKEEKTAAVGDLSSSSSSSRRKTPASAVSKSMGVLDLSAKDRSGKPPRRLSIPAKSVASPVPATAGNITPIPEARTKRSNHGQAKSETPLSEVSRASSRKRFNTLSSASYWISQIRLSESAAKHSISLGFFKLALEAGCEPFGRMRDELKSYVHRHELGEIEETVKELLESYDISDNQEQVQVSENCSQVPEEGTQSSDDEVHSSSSTMGTRKLRPRSLNADSTQVSTVAESAKKETIQKSIMATRSRGSSNKRATTARSTPDTGVHKSEKKPQKPTKQEAGKENDRFKRQGKKSAPEKGPVSTSAAVVDAPEVDKENVVALHTEEINLTEVM